MHNTGESINKRKKTPIRKTIDWLSGIKRVIFFIVIGSLIAFLLFWFMHWVTSPPNEVVSNREKHDWTKHPVKGKIGNIRVGLRIMPSANTQNNIMLMDYIKNTKQENIGGNVDKSYHAITDTKTYFPSITLKKEYVPFGDPDPYCLHLSWAGADKSKMVNMYKPFGGMNRCGIINKGHVVWHKDDPKTGIDVKMWRQEVFKIDNCGVDCDYQCQSVYRGVYKLGK
jgi:hypothetical protein